MQRVDGLREGFEIRWRTGKIVRRRRIIIDLAQRNSMPAPAALEGAGVHIVNQDALVASSIGHVDFLSVHVELEILDAHQELGLLVVLFQLSARGPAMSEIPQQFPIAVELNNAIAGIGSRNPHVTFAIHNKRCLLYTSPSP